MLVSYHGQHLINLSSKNLVQTFAELQLLLRFSYEKVICRCRRMIVKFEVNWPLGTRVIVQTE